VYKTSLWLLLFHIVFRATPTIWIVSTNGLLHAWLQRTEERSDDDGTSESLSEKYEPSEIVRGAHILWLALQRVHEAQGTLGCARLDYPLHWGIWAIQL
jgi:hypothetical protein